MVRAENPRVGGSIPPLATINMANDYWEHERITDEING